MKKIGSLLEEFEKNEKKTKVEKPLEESKTTEVIKELINTDWSKDNESQMKAVQLLKGIALSDEPEANAFMKKIDAFTSGMKKNEDLEEDLDEGIMDDYVAGELKRLGAVSWPDATMVIRAPKGDTKHLTVTVDAVKQLASWTKKNKLVPDQNEDLEGDK